LDPTGEGVQGAAELRAAWRRKVLEAHPDKGGHEEDFLAVQGAYDYLTAKMVPKQ
jgi:curved DNA-binding protein CbpA